MKYHELARNSKFKYNDKTYIKLFSDSKKCRCLKTGKRVNVAINAEVEFPIKEKKKKKISEEIKKTQEDKFIGEVSSEKDSYLIDY